MLVFSIYTAKKKVISATLFKKICPEFSRDLYVKMKNQVTALNHLKSIWKSAEIELI